LFGISHRVADICRMKNIIQTTEAPAPIGPYSQAVAAGNMLFVSVQIAIDPSNGELILDSIEAETHRVMKNIGAILEKAGVSYQQIVKTGIFLRDMNDFTRVNEVYGSYFSGDYPARETVQVSRLPKDVNVEISVVVLLP